MKKPTTKPNYTLGDPPLATETRHTLNEAEPLPPMTTAKIDGRTLRRTGRTAQFNVMLSPDFRDQLAELAERDRLTYPQLLAVMFRAYAELPTETQNAYIAELMATWGK
jgi:hypothetical protein